MTGKTPAERWDKAMRENAAAEGYLLAALCTTCEEPYDVRSPGCEEHTEWQLETEFLESDEREYDQEGNER